MNTSELLIDAHSRIQEVVHDVVEGVDDKTLAKRPGETANSIAWLVWHLTRVQDDHVAHLANVAQAWTAEGWYDRFGLPFGVKEHGYGHSSAEVAQVRAASELLVGYHDAVHRLTLSYVQGIEANELDRIVDRRWDPPVTAGVRLVSVIGDTLQHAGQAAYVRGLVERRHSA
jgi:uncharacterized damage-inducible protein DinB